MEFSKGLDDLVATNIRTAITSAGISIRAVSIQSGVPYATLDRKLRGVTSFSIFEVWRIAKVLNVRPSSLVPDLDEVA